MKILCWSIESTTPLATVIGRRAQGKMWRFSPQKKSRCESGFPVEWWKGYSFSEKVMFAIPMERTVMNPVMTMEANELIWITVAKKRIVEVNTRRATVMRFRDTAKVFIGVCFNWLWSKYNSVSPGKKINRANFWFTSSPEVYFSWRIWCWPIWWGYHHQSSWQKPHLIELL